MIVIGLFLVLNKEYKILVVDSWECIGFRKVCLDIGKIVSNSKWFCGFIIV